VLLVPAVIVTVWLELTAETSAINAALVEFSGIVTAVVTATAGLLLDSAMLIPPFGAAVLLVTVQASVPGPVKDVVLQESARVELCTVWDAFLPVPCRLTVVVEVFAELPATKLAAEPAVAELPAGALIMVTWPATAPSPCGLNCTLKSRELPAASVTGSLPIPSIEKGSVDTLICEITTAADPGLVRETLLLPD
jgi:hypothetical protein